jgi:hypothetical protein
VGRENECAIMVFFFKKLMRHHGVNLEEETQMVDGDFYSREVVASSVRQLQSIPRITGDEGAVCTWACGLGQ